jgi:hypothetical protein
MVDIDWLILDIYYEINTAQFHDIFQVLQKLQVFELYHYEYKPFSMFAKCFIKSWNSWLISPITYDLAEQLCNLNAIK